MESEALQTNCVTSTLATSDAGLNNTNGPTAAISSREHVATTALTPTTTTHIATLTRR